MKQYQEPKMEIEMIAVEDVIATSTDCADYTMCENQLPGM